MSTCHLLPADPAGQIAHQTPSLTPTSALGLRGQGLSSEAAGARRSLAPTPQPRSLAVPGEGAEEPDAGRQGGTASCPAVPEVKAERRRTRSLGTRPGLTIPGV